MTRDGSPALLVAGVAFRASGAMFWIVLVRLLLGEKPGCHPFMRGNEEHETKSVLITITRYLFSSILRGSALTCKEFDFEPHHLLVPFALRLEPLGHTCFEAKVYQACSSRSTVRKTLL